jgi:hypothetical protein
MHSIVVPEYGSAVVGPEFVPDCGWVGSYGVDEPLGIVVQCYLEGV